jgi:radical SAM protein with 4Fe4S-binding SPASM domain
MGIDYIVVDHDGTVFPTDEARMLSRSGVIDLSIGTIAEGWNTKARDMLNRHASNDDDPACRRCAFQPYCGRDLIDDIARYGRIDLPREETEFCRRHLHLFDFMFSLIYDPDTAVRYSLGRWLRCRPRLKCSETCWHDPPRAARTQRRGAPFHHAPPLSTGQESGASDSLMLDEDDGVTYAGARGILAIDGADRGYARRRRRACPASQWAGRTHFAGWFSPQHSAGHRALRPALRNVLSAAQENTCGPLFPFEEGLYWPSQTYTLEFLAGAHALQGSAPLHGGAGFAARPDLSFHILSNGQHLTEDDIRA